MNDKKKLLQDSIFIISTLFLLTEYKCFGSTPLQAPVSVNLINWAGYFAGGLDEDLKKRFPELSIVEYKSNEEALAKLTTREQPFHLAIVSTVLAPILYKNNQIKSASELFQENRYKSFLQQSTIRYCLPFQWGVTVFIDRNEKANHISLKNILEAGDRTQFYLQDDMIEIVSLLYSEFLRTAQTKNKAAHLSDLNDPKVFGAFESFLSNLKPNSDPKPLFSTPIRSSAKTLYGAIGFLEPIASTNPGYQFMIPKKPVAGADYLCMIKPNGRTDPQQQKTIDSIFSYLSSEDFLKSVSLKRKYFNPYKQPKNLQHHLESKAIVEIEQSGYVEPDLIHPSVHKKLNLWWQKFRFGYERQ